MGTDKLLEGRQKIEGQARYCDMGTDTMSVIPIGNV